MEDKLDLLFLKRNLEKKVDQLQKTLETKLNMGLPRCKLWWSELTVWSTTIFGGMPQGMLGEWVVVWDKGIKCCGECLKILPDRHFM